MNVCVRETFMYRAGFLKYKAENLLTGTFCLLSVSKFFFIKDSRPNGCIAGIHPVSMKEDYFDPTRFD